MSTSWEIDRSRLGWWLLGIALFAVLLYITWTFIGTFVFGIFIYYATRPVYSRLKRRIRPPSLAALVSLLVLAMPAILLVTYSIAIGVQEVNRFSNRYDIGVFESYLSPYLNVSAIPLTPEEILAADGLAELGEVLGSATSYLGFIGIGALHLFVMIAIAFYLLRDDYRLSRWVRHRFSDDAGILDAYVDAVDRSYHQVFFGNILNAVLTGTIGVLVYNGLNLISPVGIWIPYPSLIGLLAGAASLIPVVGMKLVYVPAAIYLTAMTVINGEPNLLWFTAAFVALSFVVVDTIPDLVLRPYVSGRNLHVGMVMFAYIFGPLLFGWYGIFLGPMLLVLVIHFARLVLPELVAGEPIKPVAVDPSNVTEVPTERPDEPTVDPSPGADG